MLSREENELLTRTGPGTAMGEVMRRYWIPALLAREIAEPDGPPVRVRLLGEDLVAFRDSDGRIGLLDEYCPHRRASLWFGATRSAASVAFITAGNSPSTAAASTR
jgi:phthalate 4,5-dioxygenase